MLGLLGLFGSMFAFKNCGPSCLTLKEPWVSATNDFDTALSEYKHQLGYHAKHAEPDLPDLPDLPDEQEMFTYSNLVCDT